MCVMLGRVKGRDDNYTGGGWGGDGGEERGGCWFDTTWDGKFIVVRRGENFVFWTAGKRERDTSWLGFVD